MRNEGKKWDCGSDWFRGELFLETIEIDGNNKGIKRVFGIDRDMQVRGSKFNLFLIDASTDRTVMFDVKY